MRPPQARLNTVAILSGVVGFVALEATAMSLYPGGTWWDPHARGHRFWENYLCDLEWRVALDGEPNPVGSRLAKAAMLVLVAALLPFWLQVPQLFADAARRSGAAIRVLGVASVVGALLVVLMPSDEFGAHGVLVIVAGAPGLAAAALAVRGLVRGERRPRVAAATGGAMLACAFVDFALHTSQVVGGSADTMLTPALQKVALILLLAWMVVVARRS